MVGEDAGPQRVVGSDLWELGPRSAMHLDRVGLEAPLHRAPTRWYRARSRLREVLGGHPSDRLLEDDLHPAVLDNAGDAELGPPWHLTNQLVLVGVRRADVQGSGGVPGPSDLGQLRWGRQIALEICEVLRRHPADSALVDDLGSAILNRAGD